jgi:hypothetical protein
MLIDPFHDAAMLLEVTSFFARMSPAGQARAAYGTRIRATCLDDMRSVPSKHEILLAGECSPIGAKTQGCH